MYGITQCSLVSLTIIIGIRMGRKRHYITLVSLLTEISYTVYPKKYAHGFVVLCFVVVMQSFIMNSHGVFIHIHQGCFAGTGAIVRLPQCQWSKPDGYGKISQSITTTKHSKAKTVCIFLGIYCIFWWNYSFMPSIRLLNCIAGRTWMRNYLLDVYNSEVTWASWRINSPATREFVHKLVQSGSHQTASNMESVSMSCRRHD